MKEKNLKFTGSKKSPNLPVWNLGDLYHSSSSQKLRKDLNYRFSSIRAAFDPVTFLR